jgi:hypothetical protein
MQALANLLNTAPVLGLAVFVLVLMMICAALGAVAKRSFLRRKTGADGDNSDGQEAYVVSAVLGLLALLMGFTFSLAVDRYEARRGLVLEEANAIGTAYLRTQLLEEPHRARITGLLTAYADNRLKLSAVSSVRAAEPLIAVNDRLVFDLWAATDAAFPTIQHLDFSSAYLDSMNLVIDLDASRKAARLVRVPATVFLVLIVYMTVSAYVMGYVLVGHQSRASGLFLLALLTLALALIIDIDRPGRGAVREGEGPMADLVASLKSWNPADFDRWRTPVAPIPSR